MIPSKKIILRAQEESLKSLGVGKGGRCKLGAVLFDRNRILCTGQNSYKTHPVLTKFFRFPHLHAEASVITRHGLANCADNSLLVVRSRIIDGSYHLSMAKPCSSCMELIKYVGIKNVFYTNWEGEIEEIEIDST